MSTPIRRYNYERSAYRWLLARHPKQFEKEGLNSAALERAPAARKALFHCTWSGAKKLVRCVEGRFERTFFFDTFINRGLLTGTRFAVEHLNHQEKEALGICEDPASGKYYLGHYGVDLPPDFIEQSPSSGDQQSMTERNTISSRKRCVADMQRKLWHAITDLVGPELGSTSAKRQITVTKAMKTTATRVTTQVIIEIDAGGDDDDDDDDDAKQETEFTCGVPISPAIPSVSIPVEQLAPSANVPSTSILSSAMLVQPCFSYSKAKPIDAQNQYRCSLIAPKIKDETVGQSNTNWGNSRVLDDLDVDILSSLF
jgi:hypothetical protein